MKKIIIICALVFAACSSGPAPKDTVFQFIDAVKNSDSTKIVQLLDIDAYIKSLIESPTTPGDTVALLEVNRPKIIQSLLGDGDVRHRYLNETIVVNKEERQDSTALVEVSFLDQAAGRQLYTKMQLHRQPDGSWRITYFK
jgi:hypothetical protein